MRYIYPDVKIVLSRELFSFFFFFRLWDFFLKYNFRVSGQKRFCFPRPGIVVRLIAKGLLAKMTANDIYAHRVVILSSKYWLKRRKRLEAVKNIKQIQLVQSLMIYYKIIIWLVIRRGVFRSVSSSIYDNDSLIVCHLLYIISINNITWSSAPVLHHRLAQLSLTLFLLWKNVEFAMFFLSSIDMQDFSATAL